MEVILLVDVKGLGKKGETKTVNDGYANNFLIARKLAVKKTEGSVKVLNKQVEDERIRQEQLKEKALEVKAKLEVITLEFKAKPQADGSLSKNISYKEIEQKLKAEYDIAIDKRKIIDKFLINAFGYTKLNIELYKGVTGTIKVHVVEE